MQYSWLSLSNRGVLNDPDKVSRQVCSVTQYFTLDPHAHFIDCSKPVFSYYKGFYGLLFKVTKHGSHREDLAVVCVLAARRGRGCQTLPMFATKHRRLSQDLTVVCVLAARPARPARPCFGKLSQEILGMEIFTKVKKRSARYGRYGRLFSYIIAFITHLLV